MTEKRVAEVPGGDAEEEARRVLLMSLALRLTPWERSRWLRTL